VRWEHRNVGRGAENFSMKEGKGENSARREENGRTQGRIIKQAWRIGRRWTHKSGGTDAGGGCPSATGLCVYGGDDYQRSPSPAWYRWVSSGVGMKGQRTERGKRKAADAKYTRLAKASLILNLESGIFFLQCSIRI